MAKGTALAEGHVGLSKVGCLIETADELEDIKRGRQFPSSFVFLSFFLSFFLMTPQTTAAPASPRSCCLLAFDVLLAGTIANFSFDNLPFDMPVVEQEPPEYLSV